MSGTLITRFHHTSLHYLKNNIFIIVNTQSEIFLQKIYTGMHTTYGEKIFSYIQDILFLIKTMASIKFISYLEKHEIWTFHSPPCLCPCEIHHPSNATLVPTPPLYRLLPDADLAFLPLPASMSCSCFEVIATPNCFWKNWQVKLIRLFSGKSVLRERKRVMAPSLRSLSGRS